MQAYIQERIQEYVQEYIQQNIQWYIQEYIQWYNGMGDGGWGAPIPNQAPILFSSSICIKMLLGSNPANRNQ